MSSNENLDIDEDTSKEEYEYRGNRYYLEVELNGVKVYALVDTGANTSFISLDAALRCGLEDLLDLREKPTVTGVIGKVKVLGTIRQCRMKIGASSFSWPLTVEKHGQCLLIGMDILKNFNAKMNLLTNNPTLEFQKSRRKTNITSSTMSLITESTVFKEKRRAGILRCPNSDKIDSSIDELTERMMDMSHCEAFDRIYQRAQQTLFSRKNYRGEQTLRVKVNGFDAYAEIDTGATMNLISDTAVRKCKLENLVDWKKYIYTVGIEGISKTRGEITNCNFNIADRNYSATFDVVRSDYIEFLFGAGLLREMQATIDFKTDKLLFRIDGMESVVPIAENKKGLSMF